ncbi:TBC domain-containing protein [Cryptosporidium ubiquitum]|uniref:TBC domain-containing protein n=1 Tax=Cryptosporidium ubiquitum TaxID=857276 RepID=A0A1J4MJD4_9CRYT|nr:TBC domain-containing protein [Cryptosporidium ubiquitum]OII74119.1 TBC domain-containing protein [Cryptosporidium ubiquitum]
MSESRRFIWCILLKLSIEDINKKTPIHELVQNADKALINQVNCDVDRCELPSDSDKLNLKRLIISVFSYRKEQYSYVQGIHDIGRVFMSLFCEYKKSKLSIIKKKLKLNQIYNNFETNVLCKLLIKKFKTKKGRMDICFKTFDKFLILYSAPYIYKSDSIDQINLEYVLSNIVLDLLYLLNKRSPSLYHFFLNLKAKDDRESKIFMFILPWILTYFSHNISVKQNKLIYYIFDNIISNHPLYIIFLVEEIIFQCKTELFDYIKQNFDSEIAQNNIENEIYPFVHFFFQNLDISSLEWNLIIKNSHKSLSNTRLNVLNSHFLWGIEKEYKNDFKIGLSLNTKINEKAIIYLMLIISILSLIISMYIGELNFLKIIHY